MSNKALQWVKNIRENARHDSAMLNIILDSQPVGISLAGEEDAPLPFDPQPNRLEIELILQGKKIPAIKEHRTRTGFGLKESKDEIDKWEAKMREFIVRPVEAGFSR